MAKITAAVTNFWADEDGQDLVEYSLLLGFIALTGVTLLMNAKTTLTTLWSQLSNTLSNATSAAS
jgi:Flp pilus assembly pilin Flp